MGKKEKLSKRERHEKKQGVFKEFISFINKGNAVALAIGVIIGGAFSAIVTAINTNIISPLIALLVGDVDLSESLITVLKETTTTDPATGETIVNTIAIKWGALIEAIINFLLIAIILFAITKLVTSLWNRVDKVSKSVKGKINEKLEKRFAEEEAKLNPEVQEAVEEVAQEAVEEAVQEAVEEAAPAQVVQEVQQASDAQIALLMEIRDLLKNK